MKPLVEGAMSAKDAAESAGIKLVGDEGQPFCCGVRMETSGGLYGTDWCECRTCGTRVVNLLSPHVNGGHCWPDWDGLCREMDWPADANLADLPTWVVR